MLTPQRVHILGRWQYYSSS